MSQNYSPSLINNGLVFCVDAADNKSAPHNQLPVKLGCVTWLDGADDDVFTFSSGTSVYEWRDKSGCNNNVYQSTTDNQPSRSTTYNSKSVVVFDGSNDSLSSTNSLDLSQGSTMFVMVRGYTSTSDAGVISINNVLSHGITIHNGNTTYFYYGSGGYHTTQSTGGTSETNLFVKVWTGETSGNRISYKNGTKGFSTGTMASSNSTGVLRLGQQSTYLNGLIGEVIIYNRELTQAEITKVNNYLQNKWNITVSDATWYDRGIANNASLENGVNFVNANNGVFNFDGTNDFGEVAHTTSFDNTKFSFSAWVYVEGDTSTDMKVAHLSRTSEGGGRAVWQLRTSATVNQFLYQTNNGGTWQTQTYNSFFSGAGWYHVCVTHTQGDAAKIYRNGVEISGSGFCTQNFSFGTDPFYIGCRNNGSIASPSFIDLWDGYMANMQYYNRILSHGEIEQNYKNFKTRFGH